MLFLSSERFVERPGGNFCCQGPKEWLLWVHEKAMKYILSVKLEILHYPEQKGPLYYIDMKDGRFCSLKVSMSAEIRQKITNNLTIDKYLLTAKKLQGDTDFVYGC